MTNTEDVAIRFDLDWPPEGGFLVKVEPDQVPLLVEVLRDSDDPAWHQFAELIMEHAAA